ncbi:hypothetical protein D3C80_1444200 [compost metagenome]
MGRGNTPACRQEHDDAQGFDVARVDSAQRHRQRLQEGVESEAKVGAAPARGQIEQKRGGTLVDGFQATVAEALGGSLIDLAVKMHDVFSHRLTTWV